MNPRPAAIAPNPFPHVISDQELDLTRIRDPGVNICLWRRPVEPRIALELAPLRPPQLPDVRCNTSRGSFDDDVSKLLRNQHLDPGAFENWRADLAHLAAGFFALSDGRDVSVRLEATDVDGCRRFHTDRTHLRLLCTYRGPGTEWLADEQVDRNAQCKGAPNEDIVRFGEPRRFKAFWVGILKGTTYPDNAGRGLVHRSPPIAGSGQTRVLVCLDC